MFAVQIGMLNLLIAIMTDTYFRVAQGSSLSAWRMSRVATNYEFINASALPEPFNMPLLVMDLLQMVFGAAAGCICPPPCFEGRAPSCLPGPSKGAGRSHEPRSAANAPE